MKLSFNWDHKAKASSGPHFFLSRLALALQERGATITEPEKSDVFFSFISTDQRYLDSLKKRGITVIQRVDGIYFDSKNTIGNTDELNRPIKDTYEASDATIFVSEFSRKLTTAHFGTKENTTVIHSGCELGPSRKVSTKRIICCSSWRRHKRLKEIHDIFLSLTKDFELLVIGKPDFQLSHKRIRYITATSFSEVRDLYLDAYAFLHLCWFDACPNAVIEALSVGLPVVCGNQGGTPELIRATNGGCVMDTDDDFDFGRVALYHPPPIRSSEEIVRAIETGNFGEIDRSPIDIKNVAARYMEFARQTLQRR